MDEEHDQRVFICDRCEDTHLIDRMGKDSVMCTSCPSPCTKCRSGADEKPSRALGAFCKKTPCSCACHAQHHQYRRLVLPDVHVMTKACRVRYRRMDGASDPRDCSCPVGQCWVDYARAEHEKGRAALNSKFWLIELDIAERARVKALVVVGPVEPQVDTATLALEVQRLTELLAQVELRWTERVKLLENRIEFAVAALRGDPHG